MRRMILPGIVSFALLVAACGGVSTDTAAAEPSLASSTTAVAEAADAMQGSLPQGPSALEDMNNRAFPEPLVDPAEIISGGPPPDGIPSIDDPVFVPVADVGDRLSNAEPVVYLEIGDEVHAYPVQVLIWHEIVNDTIGGIPVTVTYCPLCNSAVSYSRQIEGVTTTFGTSGMLYASALVMYDRATESLWTHFDGRAVVGMLAGEELEPIASPLLSWSDFTAAFPDAAVLDRDATGYDRPYGENPYAGYDDPDGTPLLFRGGVDDRARALQRVVGVALGGAARAWTLESVSGGEAQATNSEVGATPVVIFWKGGQASALDSARIVSGRDVGSVGVFSPVVDGRLLTFSASDGMFSDGETGSVWDITGSAVTGELAGTRLQRIHHLDTFWFSWSAYQPDTDLVEG